MDGRVEEIFEVSKKLFAKKRDRDDLNQVIAELVYPLRADFTREIQYGEEFSDNIYDSSGIHAREVLGNNIDSMLRQGDWFQIGSGNEERDENPRNAQSLSSLTKQMRAITNDPRSGFGLATKEADHDWVAFGSPVLSVEENQMRNGIIFKARHPKNCAWMMNDDGRTDRMYCNITMTAAELQRKRDSGVWKGEFNPELDNMVRDTPAKDIKIKHCLIPTDAMYGDDRPRSKDIGHPFLSMYFDVENETLLHEAGVPVFNFVTPRWRSLANDPYGWSPAAMNSIGDIRLLQAVTRVILEQGEKSIDPPIIYDAEVFTRDFNIFAGGATAVDVPEDSDLSNHFSTLQTGNGIGDGLILRQDTRQLIAESWLLDKLQLPSVREMREVEVMQRIDEFRRAALPFFAPIDTEYHQPLLSVAMEMAIVTGQVKFEDIPDDLADEEVKFTFTSPLHEAEGRETVAAFYESIQVIAAGSEIDNTVANIFNIRKSTEDAVRGTGAEADWILDDKERAAKDNEAEQEKQFAAAANQAQQGAAVAGDLANAKMLTDQSGLAQ